MRKYDSDQSPTSVIVIKARRKSKGGKRDGRHGSTGKVGIIYRLKNGMVKDEVCRVFGPTLKHVSRELRRLGLIPNWVSIHRRGETYF